MILFLLSLSLNFPTIVAANAPIIPNKPKEPVTPLPYPNESSIRNTSVVQKALKPAKAKAPLMAANLNEGSVIK